MVSSVILIFKEIKYCYSVRCKLKTFGENSQHLDFIGVPDTAKYYSAYLSTSSSAGVFLPDL